MATATIQSAPPASLFAGTSARLDRAEIAAARRHKVDLLLFAQLLREKPEALPGRHRAEAEAALRAAAVDNRRLLDELLRILAHLDAAGIPALPLKGPALALLLYDDLSLRHCQDLDLLVPEDRIDEALDLLESLGYSVPTRVCQFEREIHLVHESRKVVLDLHWNLATRKLPFALDFADIWADRRFIRVGKVGLRLPAPEWLLVVTCFYLVKNYPRPQLIYLMDLQRLLTRFPDMAWDRVAAIAAATGTHRICAVGLTLAGELAGTIGAPSAREHFAGDRATRAAAERVRQSLNLEEHAGSESRPYQVYLDRLRRLVGHASFRDRPTDKLRVYLHVVSLLFPWSASRWRQRGRRGTAIAASLVCTTLQRSLLRLRLLIDTGCFRPAPGTSFHPLDDAGVLFAEATQTLHSLSPSAAFIWCCLEDGCSFRRTAQLYGDASGRSLKEAQADVATMLQTWHAMDLLGGAGPAPAPAPQAVVTAPVSNRGPSAPMSAHLPIRRRYKLLDSVFEIGFANEALCRAVDPALRHLATAEPADALFAVVADVDGFDILIDGEHLDSCGAIEALVPTIKGSLDTAAVNRQEFALYLHAAMLRTNGATLLLPAAPGGGKTCLAAALARAGFAYHSDEVTLLEPERLEARGLPAALAVKDGGWPILEPLYPSINDQPIHRRLDGKIVRYLPPPVDARDPALDRTYPVRWIVFPRYTPEGQNRIERVARVEALRLLLDECLAMRIRLDVREVGRLVAWMARIECYVLEFNDLGAAVRRIEAIGGAPNPERKPGYEHGA